MTMRDRWKDFLTRWRSAPQRITSALSANKLYITGVLVTARVRAASSIGQARKRLGRTRWKVVRWLRSRAGRRTRRLTSYWHLAAIPIAAAVLWEVNTPIARASGVFSLPSSLGTLLSTIAGALASILGVTVGVVLVTLQVVRTTHSGNAVREVLRQRAFGEILSLYLLTIATAMTGLVSLDDPVRPRTVALSYLSLGLFFVSLSLLPGAIAQLLKLTRISPFRVQQLVATVDGNSAAMLIRNRRHWSGMTYEYEEEHPLFVLTEIALRSLRDRDRVVPAMIVGVTAERVVTLIHDAGTVDANGLISDEWRDTINGFMTLFRPIAMTAAEVGDERTLITVIQTMGAMHSAAAKARLSWGELVEFDRALEQIGIASIRFGHESALSSLSSVVNSAMRAHLKHNVGAEIDIYQAWDNPNDTPSSNWPEVHNQWYHVSSDYSRILATLAREAIKRGMMTETGSVIYSLTSCFRDVAAMQHLGLRQRREVIDRASLEAVSLVLEAADKFGAIPIVSLAAYDFPDFDGLRAGLPWPKLLIEHLCYIARELARRGVLDTFTLNALGTTARGLARQVEGDSDVFAEAVVLLAESIAASTADMHRQAPSDDGRFASEAMQQLTSIGKWGEGHLHLAPIASSRVAAAIATVTPMLVERSNPTSVAWPHLRKDGPSDASGEVVM